MYRFLVFIVGVCVNKQCDINSGASNKFTDTYVDYFKKFNDKLRFFYIFILIF